MPLLRGSLDREVFRLWIFGVFCVAGSYAIVTVSGWLSPSSGHVQLAQKFPQKLKKTGEKANPAAIADWKY